MRQFPLTFQYFCGITKKMFVADCFTASGEVLIQIHRPRRWRRDAVESIVLDSAAAATLAYTINKTLEEARA